MNNKKGAMELSIGAIVTLILAITFLSIGLVFVKGMLGKMFMKFDEQISREPEPPKPTLSNPISLSRNPIQTKEDTAEVIKISILNPSRQDWINRQFNKTNNMCEKVDGICFIDKDDTTGRCDTKDNAENYDYDCKTGLFTGLSCEENGKKSPCLISNMEGDLFCPNYNEQSREPDCNAREGAEIILNCDTIIMNEPFKRNIGSIQTGNYKTNILLLKLKSKIPDGQYLCQIRTFAEDKEYLADLVVKIKNE